MAKKGSVLEIQQSPRESENFLIDYLAFVDNMEAPQQFHIWTAMHAIAGALGGKCFIDMGHFQWKPNLFIIFVAPPGVISKSTTASVGTKLLQKVPSVNYGPSSATWQALFEYFIEVEQTYQVGKEKVKQSNLNLSVSELGTFLKFEDKDMIDTIVDIWDSNSEAKRSTLGGGNKTITNPWMNMIGCTTPSWIQQSVPEYAVGGGFVSRTIFVYGEKKHKLIPYPNRESEKEGQKELAAKLTRELIRIAGMNGEFKLTEDAFKFGEQWYHDHEHKRPKHLMNPVLQGYSARKQAHMHKIAMCLSAAESNDMIIDVKHLKTALNMLSRAEADMTRVFEVMSDDRDARNLQEMVKVLTKIKDGCSEMELRRILANRLVGINFDRTLEAGLAAGILDKPITDETIQRIKIHRNYRRDLETHKVSAKDLTIGYLLGKGDANESGESEVS